MSTHRKRPSAILLLAVAAFVVGLVIPAASASAGGRHTPAARPTIVLVHGAWADASSWSEETARLQHKGYTVVAPPNPLRGLGSDSDALRAFLGTISGPVVLVGHSYGGAVITNAATGNPNVKALVYVDAFAPAAGETILQLVSAQPGSVLAGDPSTTFKVVPIPGSQDADLYLAPDVYSSAFAPDVPKDERSVLSASQRPLAASAITQPSGAPAWASIPSWYVVGTRDQVLPAAEQEAMAARAHSTVVRVKASHASPISQPGPITQVILDAAAS